VKHHPCLIFILIFAFGLGCSSGFSADKLIMKSGRVYEGRILNETDDIVTLEKGGITLGFEKKTIEKIEREPVEVASNGLPSAEKLLEAALTVAPEEWQQIPATVIDEGVLRNVPYTSYRAGKLELNIYGDPDSPAGIEIGIYGSNTSLPFKKKLVAFIAEASRAEFPSTFNLDQDKKRLGQIDYEVTPPTAPDAYGAWWISAYDMAKLETARFADTEINAITIKRTEIAKAASQEALRKHYESWTAQDLERAIRPTEVAQTQSTSSYPSSYAYSGSSSGSGRVYVRGYTRKDGTYVQSHTRSKPRR
jgi:hypothetical protein